LVHNASLNSFTWTERVLYGPRAGKPRCRGRAAVNSRPTRASSRPLSPPAHRKRAPPDDDDGPPSQTPPRLVAATIHHLEAPPHHLTRYAAALVLTQCRTPNFFIDKLTLLLLRHQVRVSLDDLGSTTRLFVLESGRRRRRSGGGPRARSRLRGTVDHKGTLLGHFAPRLAKSLAPRRSVIHRAYGQLEARGRLALSLWPLPLTARKRREAGDRRVDHPPPSAYGQLEAGARARERVGHGPLTARKLDG